MTKFLSVKNHQSVYLSWKIDLFIWMAYGAYYLLLFDPFEQTPLDFIENYLIFMGTSILLFYVHTYWVAPLLAWKRPISLLMWMLVEFIGYALCYIFIGLLFFDLTFTLTWEEPLVDLENDDVFLQPFFVVIAMASAFYAFRKNRYVEEKNSYLNSNLHHTEMLFHRTQINAHQLNNELSNVRRMIVLKIDRAGDMLINLQRSLGFKLDDSVEPRALLEELEEARRRIVMLRETKARSLYIDLIVGKGVESVSLIPMLLITLVENVLQHGVLMDALHPAVIELWLDKDVLHIRTRNRINRRKLNKGKGIGLKNMKKRLAMHYPGSYKLVAREHQADFELILTVAIFKGSGPKATSFE